MIQDEYVAEDGGVGLRSWKVGDTLDHTSFLEAEKNGHVREQVTHRGILVQCRSVEYVS